MARRHRRQWAVLGLGFLALVALLGIQLAEQRQGQLDDAGERLRVQVGVVEKNLSRQLWSTHQMLGGLVQQTPVWLASDALPQAVTWFKRLADSNPGVRTINLLDAQGRVLAGNRDELVGMAFEDREYFRVAREGNDPARLYLSPPFRTVLGVQAINAVRVVHDAQGHFAGALAATLDPDYFGLLMGSVNFAPDVWTAIAHDSGPLVTISPAQPGLEGRNLRVPGSMFSRHVESGQASTLFRGMVTATGDRRLIAQQTVRPLDTPVDHALVVAVSRSEAAVLAGWYKLAGGAAAMAGLVLLVAAAGLHWMQRSERRAATRLAETLDRFERIAQTVPGVICQMERMPDGRLAMPFATRPLQPVLGIAVSSEPGSADRLFKHVHQEDAPGLREAIDASARTLRPLRREFRIHVPGEPARWLELHSVPQQRPDGRTLWTGLVVDATEQKTAREAHVALEAAQRASRAKSEFLSRASHELRTPLNAVIGFSSLLLSHPQEPLTRGQREQIGHIEVAGQHLLALIDDLLDVSAIESGRVRAVIEDVAVTTLLDEVLSTFRDQAAAAQVRIEPPQADADLTVRADRRRLKQVLLNLLSNAIKYNHPGGSVSVRAAMAVGDEGEPVTIEVQDTGPGLTREQLSHLFEPFNRLGADLRHIPGTGIGLTITKMLVELMHGRITVDTTPGRGSRFVLHLPAGRRNADAATLDRTLPRVPLPPPPVQPGVLRVLCVEDHPVNAQFVRDLLAMRPGVRLRFASSGAEGLEALRDEVPDLMLVDVVLGDMDGIGLIERVRTEAATAALRCVVLTADATSETAQRARAAGVVGYITKPIDAVQLLELIDQEAQRRRSG